jgi:lipid A 4'-phosphatase
MNRTGLGIAITLGLAIGGLFAALPRLDLEISRLFISPETGHFALLDDLHAGRLSWAMHLRDASMWVVTVLAIAAGAAVAIKCLAPRRRMRVGGRAVLFLLGTLALAPGVLANVVLKEHWGRPRPILVHDFGGNQSFVPWWDPRGSCTHNCSFIAGEPAGAFWTLAPAALAPPPVRVFAYGAAVAFGSTVGLLRLAFGAHFFTDVAFAGLFTFLIIWLVHGALYRWRATAISDAALERAIEAIVLPVHDALMRLFARVARRADREPRPGRP